MLDHDRDEDRDDDAKAPGRRSGEGSGSVFEHMMRDQQVKNGGNMRGQISPDRYDSSSQAGQSGA